jgi:transcription-repair coupling factor (superfamily II helicase)
LTELTILSSDARLGPIELKLSQATRLKRLARQAIYKEEARQLVVPIPRGTEPAAFLVGFLRELVPEPVVAAV